MDYIVGIDPGATGGVAVLDRDGALITVEPLPAFGPETDGGALAELLEGVAPTDLIFVGVEEPFPNRSASSVSQLNQGTGYGVILGVLQAMRIRHERLRPLDWKKAMHAPMGKDFTSKQKKDASRKMAMQRWPDARQHFERVKDDGLAEAALIAEATRRRMLGTP